MTATADRLFAELVNDRTVAVVGPARPDGDQSADIDDHDVVVRFEYRGAELVAPGAGSRTDVAYYNKSMGRRVRWRHVLPAPLQAMVFVDRSHASGDRQRGCGKPSGLPRANMVPIATWDLLTRFRPAVVKVYGANFYADPVPYHNAEGYLPARLAKDVPRTLRWTVGAHDQVLQRQFLRRLQDDHGGRLTGDDRFLRLLHMDDGEFADLLDTIWPVGAHRRERWDVRPPRRRPPPHHPQPRRHNLMAPTRTWTHPDGRRRPTVIGSGRDKRYYEHPDWTLAPDGEPDEPDGQEAGEEAGEEVEGQEVEGGSWSTSHVGGGVYAIIDPEGQEVDRARGADAAEFRAGELAAQAETEVTE